MRLALVAICIPLVGMGASFVFLTVSGLISESGPEPIQPSRLSPAFPGRAPDEEVFKVPDTDPDPRESLAFIAGVPAESPTIDSLMTETCNLAYRHEIIELFDLDVVVAWQLAQPAGTEAFTTREAAVYGSHLALEAACPEELRRLQEDGSN